MNLKNYTSSIPADTTIARIERMLVDGGATGIAKEYEGKRVKALVFQWPYDPQKLPPILLEDYCKTRSLRSRKTDRDFLPQAESTAWKLQQDWVEVQISLIRLQQQTGIQAFLPYIYDGSKTFYERLEASKFKALLPETT